jgi:MerR family mercuric resistance operon transcriptional regulator
MPSEGLSIGRVAAETGCNIETIRFYEKKGLLPPPARTEGGHRVYSAAMVGRLVFIRRCRELGFSMAEILELLSLVDRHEVSCERVKEIADLHLVDIRAKVADLRRMERTLADLARRCSGEDVPECPIIETLRP